MSSAAEPDDDNQLIRLLQALPDFPNAYCKGSKDAALWDFSVPDETVRQARSRRYRASMICKKSCLHTDACRKWAVDNEENGVWGGEIFPTPHAAFLKCQTCHKPMLLRKTKRRMPRGHVPAKTKKICVHCARSSPASPPTQT